MAKWEFLGVQEMVNPGKGGMFGGGFTATAGMWRSKVPGGWIVIFSNPPGFTDARHTVGSGFFYPDPAHEWDGSLEEETQDKVLLRPAMGESRQEERE